MATAVFHTAFVGDLFLAIPFFKRLRSVARSEPIVLICRPGLKEFFEKTNLVDHVYELKKKDKESLRGLKIFWDEMKIKRVICPHQSFRSAWILRRLIESNESKLAKSRSIGTQSSQAVQSIGYSTWWNGWFFDIRVERPMELPEPLRLLALLAPLDRESDRIVTDAKADPAWRNEISQKSIERWRHSIPSDLSMYLPPVNVDETLAKLNVKFPYVVIAPASQWKTKRWTATGFAKLCRRFMERGHNVYFCGTQNETEQIDEILQIVHSSSVEPQSDGFMASSRNIDSQHFEARSLAGRTNILQLHALMSRAQKVVANDSGPMHLAAAAGVAVVGIFGPTTLALGYRPWSDKSRVAQISLKCRPCGKHGHQKCPLGTHECMVNLKVEEVERLLLSLS